MDEIERNEDNLASGREIYRSAVLKGILQLALSEGEIVDKKQVTRNIWEFKVLYRGTVLNIWADESGSEVIPWIPSEEELERIVKQITVTDLKREGIKVIEKYKPITKEEAVDRIIRELKVDPDVAETIYYAWKNSK